MEATSLHPLDLDIVTAYVADLNQANTAALKALLDERWVDGVMEPARRGYQRANEGDERGACAVTYCLGRLLAARHPSFVHQGVSLSAWEARFDRGAGMLLRPPSRLFIEAGLDIGASRQMPIRLDNSRGMMGGAFIPARQIPEFERLLETRLERVVRRLVDAELDAVAVMGLMLETVAYARGRGLGLYEALDVVVPGELASIPPGGSIILSDRKRLDPSLRKRLELAARPPKKPSLAARLLRRGGRANPGIDMGATEKADGR